MIWILVFAVVSMIASFVVMARSFSFLHHVLHRHLRIRAIAVAGSVFIAAATTIAVIVLSAHRRGSDNAPGPLEAPELTFDNVDQPVFDHGEASE
jgi:hypothetical protein